MNMQLSVLESITGLNLQGTVHPTVLVSPTPIRVEFYLDTISTPAYIISTSPYVWTLDTTSITDGTHTLRAEAVYKTRRSKAQMVISVNNSIPLPLNTFGVGIFGSQSFLQRLTARFRHLSSK